MLPYLPVVEEVDDVSDVSGGTVIAGCCGFRCVTPRHVSGRFGEALDYELLFGLVRGHRTLNTDF